MIRLNCFFQANDGEQFKTALQAAAALTEYSQKQFNRIILGLIYNHKTVNPPATSAAGMPSSIPISAPLMWNQ